MAKRAKVPGNAEWAGYREDLDVKYAHGLFFGKEISELLDYFSGGRAISRADELLFMPRKAFQYYVFAFAEYLRTEEAAGDSDAASPFLRLLAAREKKDPGSVSEILEELVDTVDFVASHQDYFDADPNIYGSFPELSAEIKTVCGSNAKGNA